MCLDNSYGKQGLIIDDETENAIDLICMYLNREQKFEELGYCFHKGLWLYGNFGTGKTQMMLAYKRMKEMLKEKVGFQTCVDMNTKFLQKDSFTNQRAGYDGIRYYANREAIGEFIFDDLGEEETTINDYGNKICVMAHILSERYKGSKKGVVTHITTNLSKAQIQEIYGGRIESRVMEMFNMIILGSKINSKDYRKS